MGREEVIRLYGELKLSHPQLPVQLRDFQVDILTAALDVREDGHLMCAFPTGYGKSLPMLLLGLLMPEASTVIVVVPLLTIEGQLLAECGRYGIPAISGSQIPPQHFDQAMSGRPKMLICSVEYLADSQVRGVILKSRLAPAGVRPIVFVDEAQVLDPELGWSQFRSEYGSSSWRWIAAATRARLILMSGTMSEDSLVRVADVLSVDRSTIQVLFKNPSRLNLFLQTRTVDKIETRWRDRDLGFLLPLAVTGKKIQICIQHLKVFCQRMSQMNIAETWLKEQLRKCGHGNILVRKLSGLCSSGHKEQTMLDFRSGIIRVLFSTDVAAMGVDTPDLHIGVSLGSATTRWKNVQTTGRLARQPTEKGVFITVVEKKNALRAKRAEAAEYRLVKSIYNTGRCVREGLFHSFSIKNPAVTYQDLAATVGCSKCFCCTTCRRECGCASDAGETENETVFRLLGIDMMEPNIVAAEEYRVRLAEEEKMSNAEKNLSEDTESEAEEVDDVEEEEEEEDFI